MMIRCWNVWNAIILFSCCLTRLYVVIICDACIILDDILVIQNIIVLILVLTEGTDIVFNLIADDVWGSEDELIGSLSDKIKSWDWLPMSLPMENSRTNNIKW